MMTIKIPESPEALLSRKDTAESLTAAGYPVKPATLATKATRGGGPPYQLFGTKPLYRWGNALAWAQARLSPLRGTTSDVDGFVADHVRGVVEECRLPRSNSAVA